MGYFKNRAAQANVINMCTDLHREQMDELYALRPDSQVYFAKECGQVLMKVPEQMVPHTYESYMYKLEKEAKEKNNVRTNN